MPSINIVKKVLFRYKFTRVKEYFDSNLCEFEYKNNYNNFVIILFGHTYSKDEYIYRIILFNSYSKKSITMFNQSDLSDILKNSLQFIKLR